MEERGVDIHRNYQFRLGPGNAKWVLIVLLVVVVALAILCAQPAAAQAYSAEEAQFLVLINQYRAQNGLQPLLVSDVITVACYRHNSDMAKYSFFNHNTVQSDYYTPGATPWDRMRAEGYNYNTYMGENIAAGYPTAAAVFEGWRNSPGHNANMLGANFKVIGISLKEVPGTHYRYYWTTDFGGYVDPSAHTIGGGTPPPPPDTTPPSVSITAPQEGATVSGYAVPINVNAVDNVGVTKVELYIDSILVATDNSAPYAFTWNTLGGSDGPRRLTAKAFDAGGKHQHVVAGECDGAQSGHHHNHHAGHDHYHSCHYDHHAGHDDHHATDHDHNIADDHHHNHAAGYNHHLIRHYHHYGAGGCHYHNGASYHDNHQGAAVAGIHRCAAERCLLPGCGQNEGGAGHRGVSGRGRGGVSTGQPGESGPVRQDDCRGLRH